MYKYDIYPENLEKIIIGTGSYATVKTGNTVSVTGDGGNAWGYFGPSYKKLAPRLKTYEEYASKLEELNNLSGDEYMKYRSQIEDEYIKSYYDTRLKELYIKDLLYTLYEKFGDNIILLCHEPVSEFCHRRLIADFIELEMGFYIPEVETDTLGNIKKINPIRYKNRLKNTINESWCRHGK